MNEISDMNACFRRGEQIGGPRRTARTGESLMTLPVNYMSRRSVLEVANGGPIAGAEGGWGAKGC